MMRKTESVSATVGRHNWRDPVRGVWFAINAARRSTSQDRTLWIGVAVVLAIAAAQIFAILSLDYHDFFQDDSYISMRYSQRLLRGFGLTWTDGERVEGYSNFLWVVLVAAAGAISGDIVIGARLLGVLLAGSVPFAILRVYAPGRLRELVAPLTAVGFIVISGPIQAYGVGGLEQALLTAGVGWLMCLAYPLLDQPEPRFKTWIKVGVALGAITLTRPDGMILVAGAVAGFVLARGAGWSALRTGAKVALPPAFCFAAHMCFRHFYYHDWFPNTYYAKVSWTHQRLHEGITYILKDLSPNCALVVAVLLAVTVAVWDVAARRRVLFGLTILLFWLAYLAAVGGDLFAQHRHMIPVLCVLAVLSAEGVRGIVEWGRAQAVLAAAVSLLALYTFFQDNEHDPEKNRAQHDTFHVGGVDTGRMLRLAFAERRPLLAVDSAGCLPYYYELPCIDMLGLNDRYLAHHRPKDMGTSLVGHELGDGQYVLSRQPDIVSFAGPLGSKQPIWRGGGEMFNDPRFTKLYKLVKFKTVWPEEREAFFYMRLEGRAGVLREGARISVPGYLLYTEGTLARPDNQNRMVLELEGNSVASLVNLDVPAGRFVVSVDATGPVSSTLTWADGSHRETFGDSVDIDLGSEPVVASISVQPRDRSQLKLREIRFYRQE